VTAAAPTSAPAPSGTAPLRIEKLDVWRGGSRVVREVSLEIPPGEVTTLLGPNGAGKSTLVLAVAGVLRPSAGSIRVGGTDLVRRRPERIRAAGVAVVPEGRRLLPELSVEDNLRVATYALARQPAREGIDHALELFPELEKRWRVPGKSLSGGEQQMVVLAQALVSKPRFVLVDELSLGLAPVVIRDIYQCLGAVIAEGTTVVLVEQDINRALDASTRFYCFQEGHLALTAPTRGFDRAAITAAYFGL